MTERSSKDRILDEVIQRVEDEYEFFQNDEEQPLDGCGYAIFYHIKKSIYLMMDDPQNNLE